MTAWNRLLRRAASVVLAAALVPAAHAADSSGLEPAVVTSSSAQVPPPGATPAVAMPAVAMPAVATPARAAPAAAPPLVGAAPPPAARAASAGTAAAPSRGQDRIELESTQISGNRELPKVMYVVPWRKPDLGDFSGRPPNSLLDEALAPLDRDVFRRQNRYYASLATQAAAPGSQPGVSAAPSTPPVTKDEK
jgi:hypothetical protein